MILGVIALVAVAGAVVTALVGALLGWILGPTAFRPGTAQVVLAMTALLLVIFAVVAQRGIRRFSQPMDNLIDAAGKIEKGDYSAQLPENGPPELRSVARAFNAMSARLKANDEQRRSFLADVAHELRTPLAVIRGQAEAIADGVYPGDSDHVMPILDSTRALEVLVEDLRTLVLTEAGSLVLNREHVEPGALVQDVLASFETQGEAFGVSMASAIDSTVPMVDVDPARIRSALANVVSNAIRHTPAGGSIRVEVQRVGDQVGINVQDTGEGISPEILPRVFQRFVKGPGSTGSGLGLAITHDIITAHGGTVDIQSTLGSGTTVRITLPPATP
ncbi:MAG TPA: HAMP domain-containing sensor histidine kinase [Candidatus Dormibacteraeota bacterium]|nr:HAMP domain-containing sensor histidine kinase [Candidatus Dormibacteraeota bacterium]